MSATDRVGIEIELMGYKEAVEQMQNLDRMVRGLSGRKGYLKIKAELDRVEVNKRALRANKVKLQADMTDVEKDLKRVRKEFNALKKSMKFRSGELYNPSDYRNLFRLKKELSDLGKRKTGIADELKRTQAEIAQSVSYAERLRAALNGAGTAGKSLSQVFKTISSSVAHVGSAMQSMGNAISRLMTPLRMMTTGALLGAGFGAMNKVTEGLASGFTRYDTMKKYPKIMQSFGYSAKEAQVSIDKLDKSVRGLPTGLDEMVDMAQRFTATTGDIEKGTDIAIAANNAFLASMSTDTQKYQGMMQLQDVLGGKDMNAREWGSLVSSMTPAIVKMGESLGYTKKNMDEFIQSVRDGKMSNEDFIDTLIKVGTGTGEVAKMANESKDTWQAFTANVGNAFSRMSAGIITSLDEIVKIATGGKVDSLNMLLSEVVAPGIDNMTESIKGWIKGHPDEIIGFFNDLKSIDWKGLGKGVIDGIGTLVKGIQSMAKWLGGKNLEGVGKWLVNLNLIGQGLLVFGGILKGSRHIFAGLGTMGVGISRLLGGLGLVGASEKILGFVNFFKNFGKVGEAAKAAQAATGAASGVAMGATFKAFIPAIEAIAGIGAVLTTASGIAALDTWLISKAVNNMKSITKGIGDVFANVKGLKGSSFDGGELKTAVGKMFEMFEVLSGGDETVDAHAVKQDTNKSIADMNWVTLSKMAKSVEAMGDIFTAMSTIQSNLKGLKGFKDFDDDLVTGVSNFATGLGTIYDSFMQAFEDGVDAEQAQGFSSIVTSTKTMFSSLLGAVNLIPELVGSISANAGTQVGRGSPMERLKAMLIGTDENGKGGLFTSLKEIMTSVQQNFGNVDTGALSDKVAQIASAISSIKQIGNKMAKIGGEGGAFATADTGAFTAIQNIKTFISQLSNALDTTVVGDLTLKTGMLKQTINNMFTALNADLSNVEVKVQIKGTVTGDDDLVSDIHKAHTRITNAVRSIPSRISKTVTIDINGSVNNNLPTIPSVGDHTGGYIAGIGKTLYRKRGGGIPMFKPKGTDTVPAMLTPGEYVQSKKAVDYFGVRFMQRINNLDIRGAMRELSARAGATATMNRGSNITNNYTTNNNQSVTQNINTNNPNFAFKRSNRYITALT